MTIRIRTKETVKDIGLVTAYYLDGNYPMDANEIFLGVSVVCDHKPEWHHASFSQYRDNLEIPDSMFPANRIMRAFEFYAEYVKRMADDYQEEKEWENKVNA